MTTTFQAAQLRTTVSNILTAAGSTRDEAQKVADNLVLANLSGHDSHGVGMVPRYVDAVLEGGLKPNTGIAVKLDSGSLLALDGQRGYGQVVGEQAMQLAIARALDTGSCVMALANAHHLGRIGHFAEMAVARGLVAIHFVNVQSRPVVAPWGGGDGRYGTNPFCVGIPLPDRPPFVLDFATSRVAQGKMRVAYNEGRQVEPGQGGRGGVGGHRQLLGQRGDGVEHAEGVEDHRWPRPRRSGARRRPRPWPGAAGARRRRPWWPRRPA